MQMHGKIKTMEEQMREWSLELYRLCDRIICEVDGVKVRFTLSSSPVCYCRIRIAEDGQSILNDDNTFELDPDPRFWADNIIAYRLCKSRLERILNSSSKKRALP